MCSESRRVPPSKQAGRQLREQLVLHRLLCWPRENRDEISTVSAWPLMGPEAVQSALS